jgi:hypothetical protein
MDDLGKTACYSYSFAQNGDFLEQTTYLSGVGAEMFFQLVPWIQYGFLMFLLSKTWKLHETQ